MKIPKHCFSAIGLLSTVAFAPSSLFLSLSLSLVTTAQGCDHPHHNDRHLHEGDHHDHDHRDLRGNRRGNRRKKKGRRQPQKRTFFEPEGKPFKMGSFTWPSKKAFQDAGARCKTKDLTSEERDKGEKAIKDWESKNPNHRFLMSGVLTVPTYVHVIKTTSGLGATQDMVDAQMGVLNDGLAPDFYFDLKETAFVVNDDWYYGRMDSNQEIEMKTTLRKGGATTLNIYVNDGAQGLLGHATFPYSYAEYPLEDGVVILDQSMPGGDESDYNLGDTLIHEVGHWLNLFHVFTGGCMGDDGVADTPVQKWETYGCPAVAEDSCRKLPGVGTSRFPAPRSTVSWALFERGLNN